jgi:hypothetical protein
MKTIQEKYPATMLVYWTTGAVPCCDKHGQALIGLGRMLGGHTIATKLEEPMECTNCVNENKV